MTLAPPPTCVIVPEMRDHAPDFAPPMPEDYPNITTLRDNGWTPTPRTHLPFSSTVAASSNDPPADRDRVASLPLAWGSRLVDLGAVGHLNPSGPGGPRFPRAAPGPCPTPPDPLALWRHRRGAISAATAAQRSACTAVGVRCLGRPPAVTP